MKHFRKIFLLLCAFLMTFSIAWAEQFMVETEGSYFWGKDDESIVDAKQKAKQEAMREAIQEAGIYISVNSKAKDMQMTQDTIMGLACGMLQVQSEEFSERNIDDNIIQITCIIKGVVNINEADLEKRLADRQMLQDSIDQYNRLVQETQSIRDENKYLREKFAAASEDKQQSRITRQERIEGLQKLNNHSWWKGTYIDITPEDSLRGYYLQLWDQIDYQTGVHLQLGRRGDASRGLTRRQLDETKADFIENFHFDTYRPNMPPNAFISIPFRFVEAIPSSEVVDNIKYKNYECKLLAFDNGYARIWYIAVSNWDNNLQDCISSKWISHTSKECKKDTIDYHIAKSVIDALHENMTWRSGNANVIYLPVFERTLGNKLSPELLPPVGFPFS
ncbi:MAG: hypothetical protein K5982_02920 [Selenomonadaceae bacterium]|nr:hypothetical protein [Selenomonadaceae bacterium]